MSTHSAQDKYGRDALVIYLQDVKQLEVLKYELSESIARGDADISEKKQQYLTSDALKEPKKRGNGCLIAAIVVLLLVVAISLASVLAVKGTIEMTDLSGIMTMPLIYCGAIVAIIIIRKLKDQSAMKKVNAHNQTDQERISRNRTVLEEQYEKPWAAKRKRLSRSLGKVEEALRKLYALNITPLQYRTLFHAIYLSDFMSTSQESFEQALNISKMEEGIKVIKQRLDTLIEQNNQQLQQLAAIRQNTQTLIAQANAIFAAQVAQTYYSSISAAHASAMDAKMDTINSNLGSINSFMRGGW